MLNQIVIILLCVGDKSSQDRELAMLMKLPKE